MRAAATGQMATITAAARVAAITAPERAAKAGDCGHTRTAIVIKIFAPQGADPEQNHHHDAEKHPAVDQVVDSNRIFHAAQMADHDDHVGAQPVGDDRDDMETAIKTRGPWRSDT